MQVNEKVMQKLTKQIDKMEIELNKKRVRLDKITPHIPLCNKQTKYDNKKKELIYYYEFYCPFCGEQMYKPKNKDFTKHKCGQMILWDCEKLA